MARAAETTTTTTTQLANRGRKPGRKTPAAKIPAEVAKPIAAPKRAMSATPMPKLSKDELRAQVEKLEHANATLRAKSREANRSAKTAIARITELEDQVDRLEKKVAAPASAKPGSAARAKRQSRRVDPGVPPGVAVDEPAAQEDKAETAREKLEDPLGGK